MDPNFENGTSYQRIINMIGDNDFWRFMILIIFILQSCAEKANSEKTTVMTDSTWLQGFEAYQEENDSLKRYQLLKRTLKYAVNSADSLVTFRNLVHTAERVDSSQAALDYIQKWNNLDSSVEANFYCKYSKSRVYFYNSEFDTAIYYLHIAQSIQKYSNEIFIPDSMLMSNENMILDSIKNILHE